MAQPSLISIVDDDDSVRESLTSLIRSVGFRAATFGSAEEFLKSTYLSKTDCLLLDVRLPGISGLELQRQLSAANQSIPIILISAHGDHGARLQGLSAGAVDFLDKPFSEEDLLRALGSIFQR
jgi:FixJ family two-component response regulator